MNTWLFIWRTWLSHLLLFLFLQNIKSIIIIIIIIELIHIHLTSLTPVHYIPVFTDQYIVDSINKM